MLLNEKIRFLIVGGFNTFVGYILFFSIILIFDFSYELSMFITIISSLYIGYLTHKKYTFKSNGKVYLFIFIGLFIYAINVLIKYLLVSYIFINIYSEYYLNYDKYILGLLAITLTLPLSYILNKKYVFYKK